MMLCLATISLVIAAAVKPDVASRYFGVCWKIIIFISIAVGEVGATIRSSLDMYMLTTGMKNVVIAHPLVRSRFEKTSYRIRLWLLARFLKTCLFRLGNLA